MKSILLISFLCLMAGTSHAQILKRVSSDIKNEAEWKLRAKARQKTAEAIDSVLSPKKADKKKKADNEKDQPAQIPRQSASIKSTEEDKVEEMSMSDGYIELYLSATEVFKGGTVIIHGSSLQYGNLKSVQLIIIGPGTNETSNLALYENGTFTNAWQAETSGEFTITVRSSDGKAKRNAKVTVTEMELTDWTEQNEEETKKAYEHLKEQAEKVEENISAKDRVELQKKINDVKEKVETAQKLFKDVNAAMKALGDLWKKGTSPSSTLESNLSKLNDLMVDQRMKMAEINEKVHHEPYDNTICEYLVMLNEACAVFSTFSNVWCTSAVAILKNITIDKGLPKGVEVVNNNVKVVPGDYDAQLKQPAKLFALAKFDAESLVSRMGVAGFAGDVLQFASDYLMKSYCGTFKGTMKQEYEIIYRNASGKTWWQYSYRTEASVNLRYPKKNDGPGIIKLKGNIEGNVVKYTFSQDIEQMDDYKNQMQGRAKLVGIKLYEPPAIPFAVSQYDEVGFGAVARGVTTPSCFNIPVDAEYDKDANTIKLFLNEALIDFSPMVRFIYGYVAFAAGIPLVTRVDFPVNKARLTMNAVISKNNLLSVTKDAKNNLTIKGSGDRHIGSETTEIEHKINYTLSAQNN
jgi:hypothetical protein